MRNPSAEYCNERHMVKGREKSTPGGTYCDEMLRQLNVEIQRAKIFLRGACCRRQPRAEATERDSAAIE